MVSGWCKRQVSTSGAFDTISEGIFVVVLTARLDEAARTKGVPTFEISRNFGQFSGAVFINTNRTEKSLTVLVFGSSRAIDVWGS